MSEFFQIGDDTSEIGIRHRKPELTLDIDGRQVTVNHYLLDQDGRGHVMIDGRKFSFRRAMERDQVHLSLDGQAVTVKVLGSAQEAAAEAANADNIRAPMPGVVIDLHCEPGQAVSYGEVLITIESMKLQSELRAPRDGVVGSVAFATGETFDRDAALVTLAPIDTEAAE